MQYLSINELFSLDLTRSDAHLRFMSNDLPTTIHSYPLHVQPRHSSHCARPQVLKSSYAMRLKLQVIGSRARQPVAVVPHHCPLRPLTHQTSADCMEPHDILKVPQ